MKEFIVLLKKLNYAWKYNDSHIYVFCWSGTFDIPESVKFVEIVEIVGLFFA